MFTYTSEQTHYDIVDGKKQKKTNRVTIRGTSGHKSVSVEINGRKKTSKRKLTKKEIHCIRRCKFIPGLFKDCESCTR